MNPTQTPPTLIDKAAAIAGSQRKLGRACGVSQQAIWDIKRRGSCSPKLAVAIHRATNGAVPKWDLRPDLFDRPGVVHDAA